jgi:hypothetical protein
MNEHPHDEFDELMRRAMSEEAGRIEPHDRLHEIQSQVRNQRKPVNRRPWVVTVGAAVVGTAAAIGAFAVLDNNAKQADEPTVAGPADTTTRASAVPSAATVPPTPGPTSAPSQAVTDPPSTAPRIKATPEEAVKSKTVPIYWIGKMVGKETGAGVRLYRTYTTVSGRPAYEAVRLMTEGRSADPDYYTLWAGSAVSSVTRSDGVINVDFKALPTAQLEPDLAAMAAQQLVYTVQAALKEDGEPIQVTERGKVGTKLFGQIDTRQTLSRAKAADVQAFVWIDTPEEGQVTKGLVKVSGYASVYEGTLNWQVTAPGTRKVIAKGTTTTKEAYKQTPYAFTVKVPTGKYVLEVYEASAEDGRPTSTDSKTFSAR